MTSLFDRFKKTLNMISLAVILLLPLTIKSQNEIEIYNYSVHDCDSLFGVRKELKDGLYNLYYDYNLNNLAYSFVLKKGNVDGFFEEKDTLGIILQVGSYSHDSLWTFRKCSSPFCDSVFKVGTWRYYYCPGPKKYFQKYLASYEKKYRMIFDKSGFFREKWWFFESGKLWKENVYDNSGVLIEDVTFYPKDTSYISWVKIGNYSVSKLYKYNSTYICEWNRELNNCFDISESYLYDESDNVVIHISYYKNGIIKELIDFRSKTQINYTNLGEQLVFEKKLKK